MAGLSLIARKYLSGLMAMLLVLSIAPDAHAKRRPKRKEKAQERAARVQPEKPAPVTPDPYAGIAPSRLLEAKRRFEEAVQLEQDGNHEAAIVEFEASYELVPRPNTLYNLGLVHEKLFRYDQAIGYYELYLERAPKDDPDLEAVMQAKERLQNLLGQVRITASPPADVWLDGRRLGKAPGTFSIPAGRHVLELRKDGFLPARRQLMVASRREHDITVTLKSAKDEPPLHPAFFWTGLGLTLVTAGIGTYFAINTLSLQSEAEEIDSRIDRSAQQDEINQSALIADIFFVSAGALGIGTIISAFFTDWEGDDDEETAPSTAMRQRNLSNLSLTPWFAPTSAGLSIRGAL